MGEVYNIVFDSVNSVSTLNIDKFYFNWDKLPQGKYKVTFSFVSGILININPLVPYVLIDLGSSKVFIAGNPSNVGNSNTGQFLGTLSTFVTTGGQCYLCARPQDNPTLYLDSLPSASQVVISIRESGGLLYDSDFSFILTLSLEKI